MDVIERKIREFEEIPTQKHASLFSKLLTHPDIYVREGKRPVSLAKVTDFDKNSGTIKYLIHNSPYHRGARLVAHKVLGRYIQIEGILEEIQGGENHVVKIDKVLVAKKKRNSERVVPPKETVYANNFKITKSNMELDALNVPTFVRIVFQEYETKLSKKKYDFIKISSFLAGMPEKFFAVRQSGKTYYIRNTQDLKSYTTENTEEFLDFEEEFIEEPKNLMIKYKLEKIVSEVIMPVIFVNSENEAVVIGYIHVQSKTKFIEFEDVMEIKLLCFEMIDRIREAFTMVYTNKAEILNLSEEGLKIKVSDKDVISQISIVNGFTMDIVFKMQTPIQVSVLVRNLAKSPEGDLLVGLEIDGFRKGDKERYLEFLHGFMRLARV